MQLWLLGSWWSTKRLDVEGSSFRLQNVSYKNAHVDVVMSSCCSRWVEPLPHPPTIPSTTAYVSLECVTKSVSLFRIMTPVFGYSRFLIYGYYKHWSFRWQSIIVSGIRVCACVYVLNGYDLIGSSSSS